MTRSALQGVRKAFSSGSLASGRVDDAEDTDVIGRTSPYAGAAFEWPPADEVSSGQIVEFAPETVEERRGFEQRHTSADIRGSGERAGDGRGRGCAGSVAGP